MYKDEEKRRAYRREYDVHRYATDEKYREKIRERNRNYYWKHREEQLAKSKAYYHENKEEIQQRMEEKKKELLEMESMLNEHLQNSKKNRNF